MWGLNAYNFPLTPIIRINRNQAAKELSDVLKERDISILVVGMPSGGEAEHNDTQKRIAHFISLLHFEGQVCFVNEDYTSVNALESTLYMKRRNRTICIDFIYFLFFKKCIKPFI